MNLNTVALEILSPTLGEVGKSLFVNEMPADCTQGILLMDSYLGTPINHYLPDYISTGFRVAVRSVDYTAAKVLAKLVSAALTIKQPRQLTGMLVQQMLPLIEPHPYRRSVGAYWEFEVEFETYYVNT